MFAMFVLIVVVAVAMLLTRVYCVRAGKVRMSYFRVMEAKGEIPEIMQKFSRNYVNLFEFPMLFYAGCLVAMVTANEDPNVVTTAWVFVASRYAHSLIHTTYNNVMHRLVAFFTGVGATAALWCQVITF